MFGTSKESSLLQAATSFYKSFAIDCSRAQVSVDMWLFASAYTDVATLSKCDAADSNVSLTNLVLSQAAYRDTLVARHTSTQLSQLREAKMP